MQPLQAGVVAAAVRNAWLVIAEVNPAMPWTLGDSEILPANGRMIAPARRRAEEPRFDRDENTVCMRAMF